MLSIVLTVNNKEMCNGYGKEVRKEDIEDILFH